MWRCGMIGNLPLSCDRLHSLWRTIIRMGLIGVLACSAFYTGGARADSSATVTSGGHAPNANAGQAELVGNQWGWHITHYKGISGAFKINGNTVLLLSATEGDYVVWNPLTGDVHHLDGAGFDAFWSAHKNARVFFGLPMKLYDGRTIDYFPSPGQTFSCHSTFFQYYRVFDQAHHLVRAFYVVSKLEHPEETLYHVCSEIGLPDRHIMIDYDTTVDFNIDLPDGSLLFFDGSVNALNILRLDRTYQQHTTLDGRMFVLDADAINNALRSAYVNDPQFRYDVFLKQIKAVENELGPK